MAASRQARKQARAAKGLPARNSVAEAILERVSDAELKKLASGLAQDIATNSNMGGEKGSKKDLDVALALCAGEVKQRGIKY